MTTSRHDYRIGWICALPLELAAAQAMLDKIHPPLTNRPEDRNTYVFGSIGLHNIVIACLPAGVYGTTAATATMVQMRSSYQSIEFCLMVGIGGGAPSPQADIRLGDIVVSAPTLRYGGVIQYDHGKAINGGQFMLTGTLDKPPEELLKTLSRLRAEHMLHGNRVQNFYSDALKRYPRLADAFRYPGQSEDRLFVAEYDHVADSCDDCDLAMLQCRSPRTECQPCVFYGLIASGNRVLRDAKARDSLARQYGILCFEMEAAGLMDVFPCLVIRGVCDYSDSHKNKQWQGYAAAVAAAYTKELTLFLPAHERLNRLHGCDQSFQCSQNPMVEETSQGRHPTTLSEAMGTQQRDVVEPTPQKTPYFMHPFSSTNSSVETYAPSTPAAIFTSLDAPTSHIDSHSTQEGTLQSEPTGVMESKGSHIMAEPACEQVDSVESASSRPTATSPEEKPIPLVSARPEFVGSQEQIGINEFLENLACEIKWEEALEKSWSLARRQRSWHPWPGDCLEVYYNLKNWMLACGSALLVLNCEPRAHPRAGDLIVETISFLLHRKKAHTNDNSAEYQVIWALSSMENSGNSSGEIVKSLIQQAVHACPSIRQSDIQTSFKTPPEDELWSLLAQVLARMARVFVLFEPRNTACTASLLRVAKELVNIPGSSIKFLVIHRQGVVPSSQFCSVVRVPLPSPLSRKMFPRRDLTWEALTPGF
ncbi:hypothetical protein FE257_011385 [Aspergillus nanangensis]|uniref:Nucleoside phosphorylase domain-containing protein n=1 Tax=Aspergillus nanangensis TaxID=2582783 RepID=A0AAD4CHR7_ASPNN|nr:hypothetical protein FE257_011385 [Aspergillus nanangensis]